MSEIEDIAILGSSHKRFGYNEPVEYDLVYITKRLTEQTNVS